MLYPRYGRLRLPVRRPRRARHRLTGAGASATSSVHRTPRGRPQLADHAGADRASVVVGRSLYAAPVPELLYQWRYRDHRRPCRKGDTADPMPARRAVQRRHQVGRAPVVGELVPTSPEYDGRRSLR